MLISWENKKGIKIYRYEHEDGGGPFVKINGQVHSNPELYMSPLKKGAIYGCTSLEKLQQYFTGQEYKFMMCQKVILYTMKKRSYFYSLK